MGYKKNIGKDELLYSYWCYQNNLIPPDLAKNRVPFIYASEADLLNVALFGLTAKNGEKILNLKEIWEIMLQLNSL